MNVVVFTSGGDAPGMNAAVRAVVVQCQRLQYNVYVVYGGYQGLLDDAIVEVASGEDLTKWMSKGGTFLGSSRCLSFQQQASARRTAIANLMRVRARALVCIGGDGSLTGLRVMIDEWPAAGPMHAPSTFGIVGSIDNDVIGFTSTLGYDTALHTIISAVDRITSTARSHGRTFVVEVMGRSSGYLAITAALVCGADYVFVPERPCDAWREHLLASVSDARDMKRHSLVLIAEGAVDCSGSPITSEQVRQALLQAGHDVRVTLLGHVQRGGRPSPFDRYQGTLLGSHCVRMLSQMADGDAPLHLVVGMRGYQVATRQMASVLAETKRVQQEISRGNGRPALRSDEFIDSCEIVDIASGPLCSAVSAGGKRVALLTVGAPSPGMNQAIRVLTRLLIAQGKRVFLVQRGFEGLNEDNMNEANWMTCSGWSGEGGTYIGSSRTLPEKENVREVLKKREINALVVIGGFEAYLGASLLDDLSCFIVVIPATISLNVPGTHRSIGMDRAACNLLYSTDNIRQSLRGYQKRIFVLESIGRNCGFQALFGAIVSGAFNCYLPERGIDLTQLQADVAAMKQRLGATSKEEVLLIVNGEGSSQLYSTEVLSTIFEKETGVASKRAILSGLQQGGDPTPLDRVCAARLALGATRSLLSFSQDDPNISVGLIDGAIEITPLSKHQLDSENRRPLHQWWFDSFLSLFSTMQ